MRKVMVSYLVKVTHKAKDRVDSYSTASGNLFSPLHKSGVMVILINNKLKCVLVLEISFVLQKPNENFIKVIKKKGYLLIT